MNNLKKTSSQKLVYASDHAGLALKKFLLASFDKSIEAIDVGTFSDQSVDYPDFVDLGVKKLRELWGLNSAAVGVFICGSGQGMSMRANKYSDIRAALCWTTEVAQLARRHNDANVLCMGGRLVEEKLALQILKTFVEESFEGGRHATRVKKLGLNC